MIGKSEDIVCRDLIVLAQSNQIADGHLISPTFITGVHSLRSTKVFCNLSLRLICILPQIANTLSVI